MWWLTEHGRARHRAGLIDLSNELDTRIAEARKSQSDQHFLHDPLEDDPRFKKIIERAGERAERRFGTKLRLRRGSCHILWKRQKRILKRKYRIIWFSPAEMNPEVRFD